MTVQAVTEVLGKQGALRSVLASEEAISLEAPAIIADFDKDFGVSFGNDQQFELDAKATHAVAPQQYTM